MRDEERRLGLVGSRLRKESTRAWEVGDGRWEREELEELEELVWVGELIEDGDVIGWCFAGYKPRNRGTIE